MITEAQIKKQENRLFLSQWIKNPIQLGTFAPISQKLADNAARCANIHSSTRIVEIGAGTGRLTRALLRAGADPQKLALIELDKKMCDFVSHSFQFYQEKKPTIICGNACQLETILPYEYIDSTDIIVSAIPLMYLPKDIRQKIIEASFRVLKPDGKIIHVTYSPRSAISHMAHIIQKRVYSAWWNFPPGFVWEFNRLQPQRQAA